MLGKRLSIAVNVVVISCAVSIPAVGQNTRSAVSVTGLDTASCTVLDPCRTIATAISKTKVSGDVVVLASGGYGAFTITTSISIVAPPSVHAAITSSGDAITISAGASDRVFIRGFYLQGQAAGDGIHVISAGAVIAQEVRILNFGAGIYASVSAPSELVVQDGTMIGNGDGLSADCFGAQADRIIVTVDRTLVANSGYGVYAGYNSRWAVNELVSTANTWGLQCNYCEASITHSTFTHNSAIGVEATYSSAKIYIGDSMVTLNATGLEQTGTGTINTLGNNLVADNTADVTGSLTPLAAK